MYALVNAVLLDKGKTSYLQSVDLTNITLSQLLTEYLTGYLVLRDSYDPDNYHYLEIETMMTSNLYTADYNVTVPNWLRAVGTLRLPTTKVEPEYLSGTLAYADSYQAGYEIEAVNASSTIDGQERPALADLYIHRKYGGIALKIAENALITVNGLLHFSEAYKDGAVVRNGLHVIDKCGESHVGIISAVNVGGVKQVKIKQDMISSVDGLSLYQETFLNLETDLTNKSIIVSIGGIPFYQSDLVRVIDPANGVIAIDLASSSFSDLLPKLLEQLPLPAFEDKLNGVIYDAKTLKGDDFIRAIFNSPTSFVAIFNQPLMVVHHNPLFTSGVTGTYFSENYERDIVIDEYGRIVPYFYNGNIRFSGIPDKHVITTPLYYREKKKRVITLGMLGGVFPSVMDTEAYTATPSSMRKMAIKFYVRA